MASMQLDGRVRLDFGEHGHIDLPPEVALSLVSNATQQADIRQAVMRARREVRPWKKPEERESL